MQHGTLPMYHGTLTMYHGTSAVYHGTSAVYHGTFSYGMYYYCIIIISTVVFTYKICDSIVDCSYNS